MKLAALAALAFAACVPPLGPTQPWIDAADITGVMAPELGPSPAIVPTSSGRVRIVSFNVEKGADVAGLARAIQTNEHLAAADVILVQEIEAHPGEGGSRASRLAAALGMGFAYAPERRQDAGTHGPAILSRWPLQRVQVMALPYADLSIGAAPRIALGAQVVIGDDVLHLVDLHLDTRLNSTERILQMRPAVLDTPWPTIVGGDLNTNPFVWAEGAVPQLPVDSVVDSDQAPVIDDYMRAIDYDTPTAALGPTLSLGGVFDARLDAIYTRGVTSRPGAVERGVTISDHWPVWIDVEL